MEQTSWKTFVLSSLASWNKIALHCALLIKACGCYLRIVPKHHSKVFHMKELPDLYKYMIYMKTKKRNMTYQCIMSLGYFRQLRLLFFQQFGTFRVQLLRVYIFSFWNRPFIAWRSIGVLVVEVEGQTARRTFTPRRGHHKQNVSLLLVGMLNPYGGSQIIVLVVVRS